MNAVVRLQEAVIPLERDSEETKKEARLWPPCLKFTRLEASPLPPGLLAVVYLGGTKGGAWQTRTGRLGGCYKGCTQCRGTGKG